MKQLGIAASIAVVVAGSALFCEPTLIASGLCGTPILTPIPFAASNRTVTRAAKSGKQNIDRTYAVDRRREQRSAPQRAVVRVQRRHRRGVCGACL